MVKFLSENMKSHVELFDTSRNRFSGIVTFGGIKYGGCSTSFGWNSPGDLEHAVLCWAALRVGKKKKFKDLPVSVPYIDDDGSEKFPVILKGSLTVDPEEYKTYDENGYAPVSRWYYPEEIETDPAIRKYEERLRWRETVIDHELRRLSSLWDKRLKEQYESI